MKKLGLLLVGALIFVSCKKTETEKSWEEMNGTYTTSEFIVVDHPVCGEVRVNRLAVEEDIISLSYTLESEHSCDFSIIHSTPESQTLFFDKTTLYVLDVNAGLVLQPSPSSADLNAGRSFVLNKLNSDNLEFVITENGTSTSHYFSK